MANENGEWIMYGCAPDDPRRLHSVEELIACVDEIGFLPLFKNEVPGFSVEERTLARDWWTDDPARDPWYWRITAARSGRVAYGKFFDKKAGYVSLRWLAAFANFRRDGYDFDARFDDGLASLRQKKLMDPFDRHEELFSYELKELAGFGKGGEKNYEGTVTALQMQTYLTVKDFRCRRNKYGEDYGWHIAVLAPPEKLWGYEAVTAAYREDPAVSRDRCLDQVRRCFPAAGEDAVLKIMK